METHLTTSLTSPLTQAACTGHPILTDAGCLLYLLKVSPLASRIYLEVLGDLVHSDLLMH